MTPASARRAEATGLAAMIAATLLWGATFVVIRDSLDRIDPVPLVFSRFAVAAVLIAALHVAFRVRPSRPAVLGGLLSGALNAGGYAFQAIGLTTASAGSSAFLTCAGTLLAGFFAWPLLRVRPGGAIVAGIALALAGSALLAVRGGARVGPGEAWTLLGAAVFALQIVAVARWAPSAHPLTLAGAQALAVALVLSPAAGAAARQLPGLGADGAARFAYLAVAGSVIAPLLQVRAQRSLSPGRVGLLFALEPLFAVALAATVGAERYDARWWLGAGLILAGVGVAEARAAAAPASGRRASAAGA
uniref:DMT family transporter n=1 Tax=Eiseniibacteriota bacterium TaxID=2212470 RepID=A0A832I4H9_UNCEI